MVFGISLLSLGGTGIKYSIILFYIIFEKQNKKLLRI